MSRATGVVHFWPSDPPRNKLLDPRFGDVFEYVGRFGVGGCVMFLSRQQGGHGTWLGLRLDGRVGGRDVMSYQPLRGGSWHVVDEDAP